MTFIPKVMKFLYVSSVFDVEILFHFIFKQENK